MGFLFNLDPVKTAASKAAVLAARNFVIKIIENGLTSAARAIKTAASAYWKAFLAKSIIAKALTIARLGIIGITLFAEEITAAIPESTSYVTVISIIGQYIM